MKKIYTSYFSGIKKFDLDINNCISIALYPPKGVKIQTYPALFPTKSILFDYKNGIIDENKYTERYIDEVLLKLDIKILINDLDGKILLCYEKTGSFCHRNIFAEFMNKTTLVEVQEITEENKKDI